LERLNRSPCGSIGAAQAGVGAAQAGVGVGADAVAGGGEEFESVAGDGPNFGAVSYRVSEVWQKQSKDWPTWTVRTQFEGLTLLGIVETATIILADLALMEQSGC